MSWLVKSLSSSLGKKLLMSLTGLFLCTFLLVHLVGNLQLMKNDGGASFNKYAEFMAHNPLIETVSYGLYFFIILHTLVAVSLTLQNQKARPQGYATANNQSSWASRSMMLLGTLILTFIIMHMMDFWYEYKIEKEPEVVANLFLEVVNKFKDPLWMSFYVVAQFVLMFHLSHGFASAFQTLGLNHKKYTPAIKGLGLAFSIAVPLGFAILPLYVYFNY